MDNSLVANGGWPPTHLQTNIHRIDRKKLLGETRFACQVGPLMALFSDAELWQKETGTLCGF